MKAIVAFAALGGCVCTDPRAPVEDVGDRCAPDEVPDGGFEAAETLVRREIECDDACLVHHHEGDLVPDDVETQASIDQDVFCTCSCGNLVCGDTADIRCHVCPEGFECCTFGAVECTIGMVSDWCVREGTCP